MWGAVQLAPLPGRGYSGQSDKLVHSVPGAAHGLQRQSEANETVHGTAQRRQAVPGVGAMGRHRLRVAYLQNEGHGQRPAVGGNAQQGAALHVWSLCVATPAGRGLVSLAGSACICLHRARRHPQRMGTAQNEGGAADRRLIVH
jgi:hypothetical protein